MLAQSSPIPQVSRDAVRITLKLILSFPKYHTIKTLVEGSYIPVVLTPVCRWRNMFSTRTNLNNRTALFHVKEWFPLPPSAPPGNFWIDGRVKCYFTIYADDSFLFFSVAWFCIIYFLLVKELGQYWPTVPPDFTFYCRHMQECQLFFFSLQQEIT